MTRILLQGFGFLGDLGFQSSVARKLHAESTGPLTVDFFLPLPQPLYVMQQNPYIHQVFTVMPDVQSYDRVITFGVVDQSMPATTQFQQTANIENPSVEYEIYVVPDIDATIADHMAALRTDRPLVAFQANWAERTYLYSQEHYEMGLEQHQIITPDRDIMSVLTFLSDYMDLIEVGLPCGVSQFAPEALDPQLYVATASTIKACDWMIGGEGGLTNLAAGVGTRTIITTDFMWRQYGPDGHFKKLANPQLGPRVYFPDAGHVHLSPYLTDAEVAASILSAVCA